MVTYTEKEMVQFGTYLLSKERENNLKLANKLNSTLEKYNERKRIVFDADIENFKNTNDRG